MHFRVRYIVADFEFGDSRITVLDPEKRINVVKKIEGVTGVDNQIQVLPPSSMDDGIRMAEYRAIYSESGLMRYAMQAVAPIHIIVDTGKVTLEGVVATQSDKDLAN